MVTAALIIAFAGLIYSIDFEANQPLTLSVGCRECHRESPHSLMSGYLRKNGVDRPEKLATAVMMTSRPRLMAAVLVKESPKGKAGDSGQSKGYFQVKEKHWRHLLKERRVSRDAVIQALDSERILSALIEEKGSLKKGLNAYGGSSNGDYGRMILAELVNVP